MNIPNITSFNHQLECFLDLDSLVNPPVVDETKPPPHLSELKRELFQENHSETKRICEKNRAFKEFCMMRCEDRKSENTQCLYIYTSSICFFWVWICITLPWHPWKIDSYLIDFPDSAFSAMSHNTALCWLFLGTIRKQSMDGIFSYMKTINK